MSTKAKSIAYWTTTVLVAFFMSGGVVQIAQFKANPHGVVPELGYPMYFFAIIGFWKVLGAIAILVPRFPRLKEWAYAGIFFDLTGAAISHACSGDPVGKVATPLIFLLLAAASWALRPPARAWKPNSVPAKSAEAFTSSEKAAAHA